jgi:hypothetical protein
LERKNHIFHTPISKSKTHESLYTGPYEPLLFSPCYQYHALNMKFLGYFALSHKHSVNAVFVLV